MKIVNNNIFNYTNFNPGDIVDNKKSNDFTQNESLNKVSYKKIQNDTLNIVGPNAPKSVKDAWIKSLEETGIYDLDVDENGQDHITQMDILRVIMEEQTGGYDILGNSVESAIKSINLALNMLKNPITPTTDPQIIKGQEKEKEFYERLLENLNKIS